MTTTEQVKTILAKEAKKEKEVNAPLLNSDEVRKSNKEIIDQEVAKVKRTTKPSPKPATAKPKEEKAKEVKPTTFTRSEAMGIVMKDSPNATAEVLINKADTLYIKRTGHESNKKEQTTQYGKCVNFLKGYNSK